MNSIPRDVKQVLTNEFLKFGLTPDEAIELALRVHGEFCELFDEAQEAGYELGYQDGQTKERALL